MKSNSPRYFIKKWGNPSKDIPPLVCLHGFTGSSKTFESLFDNRQLDFQVIAIDLIGHGQTSVVVDKMYYTFENMCDEVILELKKIGVVYFSLFGYSMGARLALGIASKYPDHISHLILESGSPGLKTTQEQESRRASDEKLALKIEEEGVASFVDFWGNIALFDSQKSLPKKSQEKIRQERLSQQVFGLANSLRFMGTGSQPSFWPKLKEMTLESITLIVGELDSKFITIALEMKRENSKFQFITIKEAGHCVHLEKPDEVYQVINSIMKGGAI